MLELFSSFLSLFLDTHPKVELLHTTPWATWLNSDGVRSLIKPDPQATALIQQHLDRMTALGFSADQQGVWLQSGNAVLADHLGNTALSAASLTKTATTLVALDTWGPNRQFDTVVSGTGAIQNGVLQGDLVVQGGGDPFFVWEEAFSLGHVLNEAGIRQVAGNLVITGDFAMNFETNPATAGNLLKQSLDPNLWPADASTQFQAMPPGTPRPQVTIAGTVQVVPKAPSQLRPLVRHQSLPLVSLLKAMNIYSNNIMSEMVANSLGGATAVAQKAAVLTQLPPGEIQMANGSGLGVENRLSARAVTAILQTTQRYLEAQGLTIGNIYPVIGRDLGTLKGRAIPRAAVVKTGTLDEVSSLAGVLPTRDRGLIWFTIINHGTGDLQTFHDQQDALVQQLQQVWGAPPAIPFDIQPSDRTNNDYNRVGALSRNQPLL